jgi:hypothetical protein
MAGQRERAGQPSSSWAAPAGCSRRCRNTWAARGLRTRSPGRHGISCNHFAHAGAPADQRRAAEYEELYGKLREVINQNVAGIFPGGHDAAEVADEIVRVIGLPAGQRPFRTHIDPSRDGSEVVCAVSERVRAEFYHRIGIAELLPVRASL